VCKIMGGLFGWYIEAWRMIRSSERIVYKERIVVGGGFPFSSLFTRSLV